MLNRPSFNTLVHVPINKEIISFEVQIKVDLFYFQKETIAFLFAENTFEHEIIVNNIKF